MAYPTNHSTPAPVETRAIRTMKHAFNVLGIKLSSEDQEFFAQTLHAFPGMVNDRRQWDRFLANAAARHIA